MSGSEGQECPVSLTHAHTLTHRQSLQICRCLGLRPDLQNQPLWGRSTGVSSPVMRRVRERADPTPQECWQTPKLLLREREASTWKGVRQSQHGHEMRPGSHVGQAPGAQAPLCRAPARTQGDRRTIPYSRTCASAPACLSPQLLEPRCLS